MARILKYFEFFMMGIMSLGILEIFVISKWIESGSISVVFIPFILIPVLIFWVRENLIKRSNLFNYLWRCLTIKQTFLSSLRNCGDAEEFAALERRFERVSKLFNEAMKTRRIPEKEPEDF